MKQDTHNPLRAFGLAALVALMIGTSAPVARAHPQDQVVLTPGTVIPVKLDTELSSKDASVGSTFTATVDDSKAAYNNIMQGATVKGVVRAATPQEGDKPGTLDLAFTTLRLSDGHSYPISGKLTSLDTKNLTTGRNGILVAKNTSKDQKLTYAGIGAGAGVLADVLRGGKIKIMDVLIGAGVGYAAGTILKSPTQVHDVDLASGTELGVLLGSRVGYYHRAHKATSTVTKRVVHHTRRTHHTR
ncbi:MAG: hypothetical protein M3Y13_09180 [Armatimonadota bacterium]|nr:hypothetical protein [Armatimonadota bacterium]